MTTAALPYDPRDPLSLWYLADPTRPIRVGELRLVSTSPRGVSLRYGREWLESGFSLSEDLPLIDDELLPRAPDSAAGAVDDARPDRWGERVIRYMDRPPRLSLLEMLFFTGHDRFGALGVSGDAARYLPHDRGSVARLDDLAAIQELVRKVIANEPVPERQQRLIAPGATFGGAHPKALVAIDGVEWIVKFADDPYAEEPLLEHAAMTLAARAGIDVCETRALPLARGAAVAVKRFDRTGSRRHHVLSAHVALRAIGAEYAYPELAQWLRRRGSTRGALNRHHMRELFRRMVFNILLDNTDDHEKNHVLLRDDDDAYRLAPAFDILPTGLGLENQGMIVGARGVESSLANALTRTTSFGLSASQAMDEIRRVAGVVDGWTRHFAEEGVPDTLIAAVGRYIDRPTLLAQRREYADRASPPAP